MTQHLLPTTVVGSYPQPDWLIDRAMLATMVPRVRLQELWRIPEPYLAQAQDDATLLAIRDMERAGIDIITDGEMRRESYSNRFATALEGIDTDKPGTTINRSGRERSGRRVRATSRRRVDRHRRDHGQVRRRRRPGDARRPRRCLGKAARAHGSMGGILRAKGGLECAPNDTAKGEPVTRDLAWSQPCPRW